MRRAFPFAVLVADTTVTAAMMAAAHPDTWTMWALGAHALVVGLLIAWCQRRPTSAFAASQFLAAWTGTGYIIMLWTSYRAGRNTSTRPQQAVIVGAGLGGLAVQAVQAVMRTGEPRVILNQVVISAVFVALPLLVGRYLAQHERLLAALDQSNRQLRIRHELLAESERLRERLRIARDMHDSLGHRLSLVSVQAAALEVSDLPGQQGGAVHQLARSARAALTELHHLVGTLRGDPDLDKRPSGVDDIRAAVRDFRSAGMVVTLRCSGPPVPLSTVASSAAYRLVQEGLTNAAKHAPGQPVTVTMAWEPDTLLLAVTNPVVTAPMAVPTVETAPAGTVPADTVPTTGVPVGTASVSTIPVGRQGRDDGRLTDTSLRVGHGLRGLTERVRNASGFLDHHRDSASFRLFAMLPAGTDEFGPDSQESAVAAFRESTVVTIQANAVVATRESTVVTAPRKGYPATYGTPTGITSMGGTSSMAASIVSAAAGTVADEGFDEARAPGLPQARPRRVIAIGLAAAALMFVVLPAALLTGIR